MHDIAHLAQLLNSYGIILSGPIVSTDGESEVTHLVFVRAIIDPDGRRNPSTLLLRRLTDKALEFGFRVSFVLVDGERSDLDSSLKTLLFSRFPDLLRNSFASFEENKANIWIEPKNHLADNIKLSISSAANEFLNLLGIEVINIGFVQKDDLPTPTAILKTLRISSPCSVETLVLELTRRHFEIPNQTWMNHALDRLRKSGFIVRKRDGNYILSLKGLSALGTQRDRFSPDIVRALAFARRGS